MKYALAATIFIPLIGAFILPFIGRISTRARDLLAFAFVSASCVLSCLMIPGVFSGNEIVITRAFPLGLNLTFAADGLAVFMASVSSFLSAVIVLYSFGYISHYKHQDEYYLMVVLFLGAMMGLVFSRNLILLYLFWEITAITSWRLIGFFREKEYLKRADKAFMVTVFGALLMLIGFVSVFAQTGSFDISRHPISNIAVALILAGILSKSATLPFHTWLPDAGVAPSPVTALLHAAILVKIGLYVFARLFIAGFVIDPVWTTIIPVIAAVSSIVSGGAALVETDLKRIIAYSTVSQIGFILFALSVGNQIGVAAGLLYILAHGVSKAGLFLCAGIIEQKTRVRDITKLGGLIKTMPITAVSFFFCAASVMGIPPFGGFFSKYLTFQGAVQAGQPLMAAVFIFGAILTLAYLMRVFVVVFFGRESEHARPEGDKGMVFVVALLAALSLAGGILVNYLFTFANVPAAQMLSSLK
ncbi:MAG: NADH-quinone oxidoreductase subunit L [Deltaproteobacteria bacterium]